LLPCGSICRRRRVVLFLFYTFVYAPRCPGRRCRAGSGQRGGLQGAGLPLYGMGGPPPPHGMETRHTPHIMPPRPPPRPPRPHPPQGHPPAPSSRPPPARLERRHAPRRRPRPAARCPTGRVRAGSEARPGALRHRSRPRGVDTAHGQVKQAQQAPQGGRGQGPCALAASRAAAQPQGAQRRRRTGHLSVLAAVLPGLKRRTRYRGACSF
jgi:hypothetical protein